LCYSCHKHEDDRKPDQGRREFLKALGVAGATVAATGVGMGVFIKGKEPKGKEIADDVQNLEKRTEKESHAESGTIVKKEHEEKQYANPIDNLNPMRDVDPLFDLKRGRMGTTTPEEFILSIQTEKGMRTVKVPKSLFDSVQEGMRVQMKIEQRYEVDFDKRTNEIQKKQFEGEEVINVTPEE
jgi:hypothetical protein